MTLSSQYMVCSKHSGACVLRIMKVAAYLLAFFFSAGLQVLLRGLSSPKLQESMSALPSSHILQ